MRVTSCNGDAVTSRSPVLDPRKNETLDVVTSKDYTGMHDQQNIKNN